MGYDDSSYGDVAINIPKEDLNSVSRRPIERDLIQIILADLHELKNEVFKLQKEAIKSNQRIAHLEDKKRPYGKEVCKRVYSMLKLINDYGDSMPSADVKKLMGLSKDELYRTLRCAKEESQIELIPNEKDRRGYIIKIKLE